MANGLTFEILNIILRNFHPCYDFNRKWPLQNFKKISLELREKSPKIMRSWLVIFNLTASIGDNNAWAVKGIILQCTDLLSESLDIHVFARIAS